MPSEYTSTSRECNRRLAGIASHSFFSAQIGFSQIIMLNDCLSKTVDENVVEIAKLKKSANERRVALIAEVRLEVACGFEERLAKQGEELLPEKEACCQAVREERDPLREKVQKSSEIEKALLEEQDALLKEVDALKMEKAALLKNHEAELATVRA
ncbi:unnamed protein product [Linum trigynum]|uniref:Uncharacterized protein n=1 Tax=Linum trigynum TaxID=586398 RepID=A0AAV2GNK4_9ROSI